MLWAKVPSFRSHYSNFSIYKDLAMLESTLKVLGPTNVGDTIHVEVEVLSVRQTSKGNRGIVKTMNNIVNQKGETVATFEATRMMAGR